MTASYSKHRKTATPMIAMFSFLGFPFQIAQIHCGISGLRPQAKRNSLDQQPHRLQQLSFGDQLALATEHTKKAATQCAKTWAGRVLEQWYVST